MYQRREESFCFVQLLHTQDTTSFHCALYISFLFIPLSESSVGKQQNRVMVRTATFLQTTACTVYSYWWLRTRSAVKLQNYSDNNATVSRSADRMLQNSVADLIMWFIKSKLCSHWHCSSSHLPLKAQHTENRLNIKSRAFSLLFKNNWLISS